MSRKPHWIKGKPEAQLFEQDKFALVGLPPKPFGCVSYVTRRADKEGKVSVGEKGGHIYSTGPSLARQELIVGLRTTTVGVFTADGTLVCAHNRAYGSAPTDRGDPSSQPGLLAWNIGVWENSQVRAALPDDLKDHMDSFGKDELKAEVRVTRDQVKASGWAATPQAMSLAYAATGRIDETSVALSAARAKSGAITYDEPVDLSIYDKFMGVAS